MPPFLFTKFVFTTVFTVTKNMCTFFTLPRAALEVQLLVVLSLCLLVDLCKKSGIRETPTLDQCGQQHRRQEAFKHFFIPSCRRRRRQGAFGPKKSLFFFSSPLGQEGGGDSSLCVSFEGQIQNSFLRVSNLVKRF